MYCNDSFCFFWPGVRSMHEKLCARLEWTWEAGVSGGSILDLIYLHANTVTLSQDSSVS